jgi:hypothetical protein
LLITGGLFVADFAVGELLVPFGLSALGVLGDLMLLEVGILAVLGGLVEFSRSKGVYEFRRLALRSKEEFSTVKHLEASRVAVTLFSAALALFFILIVLALAR